MPTIQSVQRKNGIRYWTTCDVAPPDRDGKRNQRRVFGDTEAEVQAEVDRLTAWRRRRTRPDLRERLEADGRTPAPILVADGECTRECLFALENECICRCRSKYHGQLQHLYLDALVDTDPANPPPAPRRAGIIDTDRARLLADRWLRAVRMQAGMTQEQVCRAAGNAIQPTQLGRAERGTYELSLTQLLAVASVLELGLATLDDVAAGMDRATARDGRLAGGHVLPLPQVNGSGGPQ